MLLYTRRDGCFMCHSNNIIYFTAERIVSCMWFSVTGREEVDKHAMYSGTPFTTLDY